MSKDVIPTVPTSHPDSPPLFISTLAAALRKIAGEVEGGGREEKEYASVLFVIRRTPANRNSTFVDIFLESSGNRSRGRGMVTKRDRAREKRERERMEGGDERAAGWQRDTRGSGVEWVRLKLQRGRAGTTEKRGPKAAKRWEN